ncbi:MAG: hypothetical protein K2X27_24695, partial [Candidatus Obscuribacterales bacterium]|nr:hypothetical protein [Candidatus Obscuribacterales bacterium]
MQEPKSREMEGTEAEEITLRLAESVSQENVLVLKYSSNLLAELEGLSSMKRSFDVVIIDSSSAGFLFPAQDLVEAARIAKTLLEVQGSMVFVKQDKAAALIKESAGGFLSFHVFENLSDMITCGFFLELEPEVGVEPFEEDKYLVDSYFTRFKVYGLEL